jgi:hypothetical protein
MNLSRVASGLSATLALGPRGQLAVSPIARGRGPVTPSQAKAELREEAASVKKC